METKDRGADRGSPTGERPVAMPGSRLVTPRVSAEQTGGAYSLFEVEVEPGGGEGPHVQHREDECLYVVAGRFGFAVEDVETEAGPGTHLYVPKGALHAYTNNGAGPAEFTALAAEHGMEIFEKTEQIKRSF